MTADKAILRWPSTLPSCDRIGLRRFRDEDLALIEALSTDPYIPTIGTVPAVWSTAAGRAFIARQHQRTIDGVGFSMVIARLEDDLGVGTAGLWLSEESRGLARVGYTVAPEHRGHGYATMALRALVELAWTRPALRRIEAHVEPWNTASRRVVEHVGFSPAGLLPDTDLQGRHADLLVYALTRE